ncbi:MAG: lysophospholipid acyltransferase family protein [Pseudomonadota bacterium]
MTARSATRRAPKLLAALVLAVPVYGLLLGLGLVSLGWNLLAVLLRPLLPARFGRALGRHVISGAYRCFWAVACATGAMRIDDGCLDALRDERGLILIANHPTMLDALLLVARLPRSACIMKADLMRNVFLGGGARLARYIANDSPRTMIKNAVDDLQNGGQLVLFPEGTRTVDQPINAFRPGVTLIAKRAQVPIQTVFIDTDTRYLSKGWPLWRVPALPLVFRLRLGQRFAPSQDSDALLRQLEQYFRHQMEQRAPDAQPACQSTRAPTLS